MLASEMTPGTVYSHVQLGLVTPVRLPPELEGVSTEVYVLCLSKSREEACGTLNAISANAEVHKAFGIY
jgi:hypothetical protein